MKTLPNILFFLFLSTLLFSQNSLDKERIKLSTDQLVVSGFSTTELKPKTPYNIGKITENTTLQFQEKIDRENIPTNIPEAKNKKVIQENDCLPAQLYKQNLKNNNFTISAQMLSKGQEIPSAKSNYQLYLIIIMIGCLLFTCHLTQKLKNIWDSYDDLDKPKKIIKKKLVKELAHA